MNPKNKITRSLSFNDRPAWFKAMNSLWKSTYVFGTEIRLDKDDLIKTARKRSGFEDLGKDFWDEPLDMLLYSLNQEANLHPFGRFISKERLVNLLSVRLRAEWWFKNHPGILEQELYPVMMIMGLQRTGTTKLQRMLASDPDNRVLYSWEAINPVPLHGRLDDRSKRVRIARTSEKALKWMAPGFFAIHPVEHLQPEEDILLLDVTFLSTTPEATTHVPSYASWLEITDQSPAYEYGAKLLKFLQWQRPAKRWVLKSPHHMEFLALAQKYYGNVHFLWTHRDISQCVPSFLSMVGHSRGIFSNDVTLEAVAMHWVRKIGFMLTKGMGYRQENGNDERFTDIIYDDFIADPLPDIQRIYEKTGGLDESHHHLFKKSHEENPQGKYGHHHYALEDFGLSLNDLEKHANGYPDYYNILKNKIKL